MTSPAAFLDDLNHAYEQVHTAKEDAFWAGMMGLGGDAGASQKEREEREIAWNRFLQDPERLGAAEQALATAEAEGADETTLVGLRGWVTTLRAHGLASAEARALSEDIVNAEGALNASRGVMNLGYEGPGGFVPASSVKLGVMVKSDQDRGLREAAWRGLRSIEDHVLANGFLEVVKQRNAMARLHGFDNYYAWKVERTEQLTIEAIFALLDDLEEATREPARRFVEALKERNGGELEPWDVHFHATGDSVSEQSPYFRFADSVDRWGRSFAALGIDYDGARLVLDLVDRKGKYENGFMHGPEAAWTDRGDRKRARIHFTSNAIPGMVGAGQRATQTLFHEGGHAAHFANIDMPAPCFAQEFAPTSAAFAETQSMFLDSLLEDADWLKRYAKDADGEAMPMELIERGVSEQQPVSAWDKRGWLCVCYGERAIYQIPDAELTAERVQRELRAVERRMMLLDNGSPRPVLSVPHLLSGESSAYYHAYVLAEMAVAQTRRFFQDRDGHIVDNPRVGPELRDAYWKPGNSRPFFDYIKSLTGTELSAAALSADLRRSADEALREARDAADREPSLPRFEGEVALNADIRIAHGDDTVAQLTGDWDAFAADFRAWVEGLESASA